MPSQKNNQEDEYKSEIFRLGEKLDSLDALELNNLIKNLIEKSPESYRIILEWLKEKEKASKNQSQGKKSLQHLNDELLMEYWSNAEKIISEFNEYGGGPEDEEEEAYDWLNKITKLIKEGSISKEAKFEFLDDAFEEYNSENSGFEDALMDIFFEICSTKEDWEYLVKKLDEQPTEWRKKLIMDIQKNHLHRDNAYLEERLKILRYGLDYWDLAKFYIERGEIQKALESAEQGILKGEGRLTELFEFLFDHFSRKRDALNLERIMQTALTRKSDEKNMCERLFAYYKAQNDYENAKKSIMKSFDFCSKQGSYSPDSSNKGFYAEYNRMKEFLKDSDWSEIEPIIFRKVQEKDIHDYLRICLDKNLKQVVLSTILNPPEKKLLFGPEDNFDEFADRIKEDFPEEIIEYHWKKAYRNILLKNRGTYHLAAASLANIKHIYISILKDKSTWNTRFSDLKDEFKNRPAFIDEVKEL